MLVIDKSLSENRLLVTFDHPIESGNDLVLKIGSMFSNKSYQVVLPENTSQFPKRVYEFIIGNMSEFEVGKYTYRIVEAIPETITEIQLLEIGLLEIIDSSLNQPEFITLPTQETDDDFIVYEG